MPISSNRLTFIDAARCYAVFLALLSHALLTIGIYRKLGADIFHIFQFTRMATPMFVFMFGFMIELVYVRRAEKNNQSVVSRLFVRSFQCYVAYALTSLCALLGGFKSLEGFVTSLIFLSDSRFGNILRIYSVMLILSPIIIKLRRIYGVKILYFFLIALLTLHSQIHEVQSFDFGAFGKPLNILFGIGNSLGGPSVAGAFIFYISGMIVAASLRSSRTNLSLVSFYKSVAFLLLIMGLIGWVMVSDTPVQAWKHFSDFTYRKHNAPGYFIIGTICSLIVIALFSVVFRQGKISKYFSYIMPIGTSSLISYTVGNVILNLFGMYIKGMNLVIFIPCFFGAVILITRNIQKLPFHEQVLAIMNFEYNKVFQRTSR